MLTVPDLLTLSTWLKQLDIGNYQCDHCYALHLPHLQDSVDIYDAKIELIDDTILFSVVTEAKLSAIPTILAELSQINSSTFFAKAYLNITEENEAKIILSYAINCVEGISENQFSSMFYRFEEEALQIVAELGKYELLKSKETWIKDLEDALSQTFH